MLDRLPPGPGHPESFTPTRELKQTTHRYDPRLEQKLLEDGIYPTAMDYVDYRITRLPEDSASLEAKREATDALAHKFHEAWRRPRVNLSGRMDPREKPTGDKGWIEAHGYDVVDIANTEYDNLPEDWKQENRAAAEVVVELLDESGGHINLKNQQVRQIVGQTIHEAWLSRQRDEDGNAPDWVKEQGLDQSFKDLSDEEQDKDIRQVEVALRLFDQVKQMAA